MGLKRVLKWNVPVDHQRHSIGDGWVIHVESQNDPMVVQVWTEEDYDRVMPRMAEVQVYGTGQPYPDNGRAIGSAVNRITGNGTCLVWHVVKFRSTELGGYVRDRNS